MNCAFSTLSYTAHLTEQIHCSTGLWPLYIFQRFVHKAWAFAKTKFRRTSIGPCYVKGVYSMTVYLLVASLAPFSALLAVDECTVHNVIVLSFSNFISSEVPACLQTVHWNMPYDDAEYVCLAVLWAASMCNEKAVYFTKHFKCLVR